MSRWYKTDLQIASLAGGFSMEGGDLSGAKSRATAVENYVSHIKAAGIEVFAVTDHNSTSMLEEIGAEAKRQGLVMFPGMELSTSTGSDGVHLLLLGDPEADIPELTNQWHTAAGFSKDHPAFVRSEHQPSRSSIIDILAALPEDTIAIAPHILNENGVASRGSIKEKSIRWRCLHHDRLEAVDVGISTGTGWNDKFRTRQLDNFPVLARMAFVSTSDAYSVDGLGRHTWIRMHRPDLASLRQALLDFDARIFCDSDMRLGGGDPNLVKHAHIDSIRIVGMSTSAEPLEVTFDPRITVIIGSRGSGKSTIVQGLRAVYGADANLPETIKQESEGYQHEVFAKSTIESKYVEAISGARDTASWQIDVGTSTKGDHSLINVRVVSQKELFERTSGDRSGAQSSSANMIVLVDEALDDDKVAAELVAQGIDVAGAKVAQFASTLDDLRRAFAAAAGFRLDSDRKLAGRKKIEESLAEVKRKLGALDDEQEKEKLKTAQATISDSGEVLKYANKMLEWADAVQDQSQPTLPTLTTSTATAFFTPLNDLAGRIESQTNSSVLDVKTVAEAAKLALDDATNAFAVEVFKAEGTKSEYETKLKELGVDLSQYGALQVEQTAYEASLTELDEIALKLPQQVADEAQAWKEIDNLYAQRFAVRKAFTAMISLRTPSLRFIVSANADSSEWCRSIHEALGFRSGDHVEALRNLADWIWKDDQDEATRAERSQAWRGALLENDYAALATVSLTQAFVGRLKQSTEMARVEIASLKADDALDMESLKEGHKPENSNSWQTVTLGSPGQRSAAMLAFTLSYGDSPLVLDQPEDDLDSALVSELIVKQFRDARWKRQLIVVTHEANIPVNTDAEVTVVLENADGSLRVVDTEGVKHAGPIDSPEVRRDIQDLLEGGVRAFVNRERRYDNELSKYRIDVGLMQKLEE